VTVIDRGWWVDALDPDAGSAAKDAYDLLAAYCGAAGKRPADFILYHGGNGHARGNPMLRKFARESISVRGGAAVGLRFYPWAADEIDADWPKGWPSWLYPVTDNFYTILVDWLLVTKFARERIDIVLTKLFVHEFAHLYYHRDNLCTTLGRRAKHATELQEDQAWAFAGAFVGICLGDFARFCHEETGVDQAWKFA